MGYIIPNQGDNYIMSAAFQGSSTYLSLNLLQNNPTLTADMVSAACSAITGAAYTELLIHKSAWCVPYFTAGSAEVSASGNNANGFQFSFSAAPDQTAFGYFIANTAANVLICAETFASSYTLANSGDTITIKPKIRAT
jgi:hypothetical protein